MMTSESTVYGKPNACRQKTSVVSKPSNSLHTFAEGEKDPTAKFSLKSDELSKTVSFHIRTVPQKRQIIRFRTQQNYGASNSVSLLAFVLRWIGTVLAITFASGLFFFFRVDNVFHSINSSFSSFSAACSGILLCVFTTSLVSTVPGHQFEHTFHLLFGERCVITDALVLYRSVLVCVACCASR
jgi:hypothetical protein